MTEQNERTVRWGILGAGRIAHRFATSLAHEERSRLVALSCRSEEKAATFAAAHDVPAEDALSDEALGGRANAAHEALLARNDIDVIYLALPHGLHRRWATAALRAGKAVLCEKPATLNAAEMREVSRVARETGHLFMEAMKTRFTSLYRHLRELVLAGAIGEVVRVETALENDMGGRISSRTDYMSDPRQGGVLLDTGIYCAGWLEDYLPGAPTVTNAVARYDTGVDSFVDAELVFGAGGNSEDDAGRAESVAGPDRTARPLLRTARLIAAGDTAELPRQARIVGTAGKITADDLHRPQHARLILANGEERDFTIPYEVDDFFGQIRHMTDLVLAGAKESPVMSLSASIRCAEILDAIRAALPAA